MFLLALLSEFYFVLYNDASFADQATIHSLIGGGEVAKVAGNATAVTPAWRGSVGDFTIILGFNESTNATDYINARNGVHAQIEPFRQFAPVPLGGQYLNEASRSYDVPRCNTNEADRAITSSLIGNRLTGAPTTRGC